jgi:ribosomal protein S18 acetylase RimI-like enzyme
VSAGIRLLAAGDEEAVFAARALFDHEPGVAATRRFLADPGHHLLVAYDAGGEPVGFVTGVELTHPDKGTEMFLYELGVDAAARRRGVGRSLVEALAALARERGCYDIWTVTETDNVAARATYLRAGAQATEPQLVLEWDLGGAAVSQQRC